MGGMIAYPHIRGGGEYGKFWHESGKKENRQNSFDDFIAAAEYLIENKYTDSDHLVAQGGSSGGILMAVVANQRPDLFRMVKPMVAVTDMVRVAEFTSARAGIVDYGNANSGDGSVQYLMRYSPYHNVKTQKYPIMLITTGDHDDRVVPLHSYKYVAQL